MATITDGQIRCFLALSVIPLESLKGQASFNAMPSRNTSERRDYKKILPNTGL